MLQVYKATNCRLREISNAKDSNHESQTRKSPSGPSNPAKFLKAIGPRHFCAWHLSYYLRLNGIRFDALQQRRIVFLPGHTPVYFRTLNALLASWRLSHLGSATALDLEHSP